NGLAGALWVRRDGHRVLRASVGATRTQYASVRETAGTNVGEASLMSKPPETPSLRVLSVQILSHALIFGAQNTGGLAERALLATHPTATATLGVSWIAFCLLQAFAVNMVNVCPFVVGRCTGDRDDDGARAAAVQASLLASGWGAVGIILAAVAGGAAALAVGP